MAIKLHERNRAVLPAKELWFTSFRVPVKTAQGVDVRGQKFGISVSEAIIQVLEQFVAGTTAPKGYKSKIKASKHARDTYAKPKAKKVKAKPFGASKARKAKAKAKKHTPIKVKAEELLKRKRIAAENAKAKAELKRRAAKKKSAANRAAVSAALASAVEKTAAEAAVSNNGTQEDRPQL